jgi:hypothetical protein
VKLVEEIGLPELSSEQIEQLCTKAEDAARKYVLSRLPKKAVERLDISVEAEDTKPLDLKVEVDLVLSPRTKDVDCAKIVDQSVKEAFKAGEIFLRKLT